MLHGHVARSRLTLKLLKFGILKYYNSGTKQVTIIVEITRHHFMVSLSGLSCFFFTVSAVHLGHCVWEWGIKTHLKFRFCQSVGGNV